MSPGQVFLRLVESVSAGRWHEAAALYAEDAVVAHPMSGAAELRGAAALRRHFEVSGERIRGVLKFEPGAIRIHETADPEVVVAEFEYRGRNLATDGSFAAPCVFVLRVKDGKIVESRDYIHHAAFAAAALA